jgi:phosphoribosyl 1,2-cyclic phosphodiesterase
VRFASLGSGSSGNALVVEAGETRLMLDCGFGLRACELRLERLELSADLLTAIVVTHEHSDHMQGVARLASKYALPVYLTYGAFRVFQTQEEAMPEIELIDSHEVFAVDGLEVRPFPVPHDAQEPVQYIFGDGDHSLGVLTDAGHATPHMVRMLSGLSALVLECNHDPGMLRAGSYPEPLKRRILGRYGHLDNHASASLLSSLDTSRLQHLVAAHLSEKNNTPELARSALSGAMGCEEKWIAVADQQEGLGWRSLC